MFYLTSSSSAPLQQETFTLQTVKSCPHTRHNSGIIIISPKILAAINGAVTHHLEWAIILLGERKSDGYVIEVDGFDIPPDQIRSTGLVQLPLSTAEGEGLNPHRTVGVLHSHHKLPIGARFSGTDYQDFNTKYPVSIVIAVPGATGATRRQNSSPDASILGFDYYAEGRVTLPCGALGVVKFEILPRGIIDWPRRIEVRRGMARPDDLDLGNCYKFHVSGAANKVVKDIKTECGITKAAIPDDVFGERETIWNALTKMDEKEKVEKEKKEKVAATNGVVNVSSVKGEKIEKPFLRRENYASYDYWQRQESFEMQKLSGFDPQLNLQLNPQLIQLSDDPDDVVEIIPEDVLELLRAEAEIAR